MKYINSIKFTLTLATIIFGFNACNKEKEIKTGAVWGNIVDAYTGEPLEGVKVYIFNSPVATSLRISTYLIDSTYTNQNGGYYKKFRYDKGEAFQIKMEHPGYYWNRDVIKTGINQPHHSLINLSPNRNFIINIQNTIPVLSTDSFFWYNATSRNGKYTPIKKTWFKGETDTTIFIPIALQDNNWYFQYRFKDSLGVWNFNTIKPYCEPHDTLTLDLTF